MFWALRLELSIFSGLIPAHLFTNVWVDIWMPGLLKPGFRIESILLGTRIDETRLTESAWKLVVSTDDWRCFLARVSWVDVDRKLVWFFVTITLAAQKCQIPHCNTSTQGQETLSDLERMETQNVIFGEIVFWFGKDNFIVFATRQRRNVPHTPNNYMQAKTSMWNLRGISYHK